MSDTDAPDVEPEAEEAEEEVVLDREVLSDYATYFPTLANETITGELGENPSQEALDEFFDENINNQLLQTSTYRHSLSQTNNNESIAGHFEDLITGENAIYSPPMTSWGLPRPLSGRTYYYVGAAAGSSSGGAVNLDVDYLYSPFVAPAILSESFELGAAIRAGFMPALRPGDPGVNPGDGNFSIVNHPDRHATIRVMSIDKQVIYATTNFMMEGYNKSTQESYKILESTLGNTLQLNKEKFKIVKIKLGLIDAQIPFDWLNSWEDMWNRVMRASVLAKNRWRWYILFGSHIIGGYPLQYSMGSNASDEPFTGIIVDVFVTDDRPLPPVLTLGFGAISLTWDGVSYTSDEGSPDLNNVPETEYESVE